MIARTEGEERLVRSLREAYRIELEAASVLARRVANAPPGDHRAQLEHHLEETDDHIGRLRVRLELFDESGLGQRIVADARDRLGSTLRLGGKLTRRKSGPQTVLSDAIDQCATEAVEIATYEVVERLAKRAGDRGTVEIASQMRADDERALISLHERLPELTEEVTRASAQPKSILLNGYGFSAAYNIATAVVRLPARLPGVAAAAARALGGDQGSDESGAALAITDYDSLSAKEVIAALPRLSDPELARLEAYEREHKNRSTVRSRVSALRQAAPGATQA